MIEWRSNLTMVDQRDKKGRFIKGCQSIRLGKGKIKINPSEYKTKVERQKLWAREYRRCFPKEMKEKMRKDEERKNIWWYGEDFIHPKTRKERYELGRIGEEIAKELLPALGFINIIWFNNNIIRSFFDFKAERDGKICVIEVTTGRSKDIAPHKSKGKMSYPEIAHHLGLDYYVLFISISKKIYCLRNLDKNCYHTCPLKNQTYQIDQYKKGIQ